MKEDAAKRIVEEKSINSDIYFGYKRFKQKLYNAYLFYNFQKNKEYDFKNES